MPRSQRTRASLKLLRVHLLPDREVMQPTPNSALTSIARTKTMGSNRSFLRSRAKALKRRGNILDSATVYLSGPMDFVASREEEKAKGWRTRVAQFLQDYGTTVYDPWNKPEVSGMPHFGKEDEFTANRREAWTYDPSKAGSKTREVLSMEFWPTLHIDLRMTDLSDFVIAYCPTNIYSVGTVHEIAVARQQRKPVLLVTPQQHAPALTRFRDHLKALENGDETRALFAELEREFALRANPKGIPSLWYMAMLDHEDYFFDGFGFGGYADRFGWEFYSPLDEREREHPPARPLLPYLERLNREIPKRFDQEVGDYVDNPEWLIFVDEEVQS